MGAAVVRLLRDFNLEARVQREISRAKPRAAPRHPSAGALAREHEGQPPESPRRADRDEQLLRMLRGLHVRATDGHTDTLGVTAPVAPRPPKELRPRREPGADAAAATCIPKGRISLVEALTLLDNHKRQPETWTAERIAREYQLDPRDVSALLRYFLTFEIKVFPPQDRRAVQPK
ncbi:NADH dehydrogenase [ubiquinone] 1 alpha subcomplex assembly factor 4 [Erinaceus europaeus]|uniref:NADH dehydrogenase [ubiquinone] 1 alpha subcomplex assembly factor 4 n=1 Tax=Erinaceus europaeus TaxID=9365 RepID=A0ABM3XD33_ERIEU|nr:NADH dehydrogenase [ubiquinone] 1 alpha subcomplex assembly factor 4 [Erinaceus europaeus]